MNRRSRSHSKRVHRQRTTPPVTWRAEWGQSLPARPRSRRYEARVTSFVRLPRRFALPSLSWRAIRRSFLKLVGLGILVAVLYLVLGTPYFRIQQVRIEGTERVSPAEIEAALEVKGRLFFTLSSAHLERNLRQAFPELANVEVELGRVPNEVHVRVRERQPIIRWELEGRYTWIDAEGIALRPRGDMPNLVRVRALTPPPPQPPPPDALTPPAYLSVEMVEALRRLATFLPPGTPILYDAHYGFGWED
ncbi:MAG: cell division protein FtsQ/DivIB, partial [Anaerolineales bacterium]